MSLEMIFVTFLVSGGLVELPDVCVFYVTLCPLLQKP